MRFLIDQNRSPRLAELLRGAGHDAGHTLDLGLEAAEDDTLLHLAIDQSRIVVSGDTDFGTLLAATNEDAPSVILFRGRHYRAAEEQAALILTHLDDLSPTSMPAPSSSSRTSASASGVYRFAESRRKCEPMPA